MKINFSLLLFLITSFGFSQSKNIVYINEDGDKINKRTFNQTKDYRKNLDLYFENDTIQYGILITRQKFGYLDHKTFKNLKGYLKDLSGTQIDSTKNIVINYLTSIPKKIYNKKSKSTWTVLDRDYLKKLHKIADIEQFWINSPESDNLNYYHQDKIEWIADKNYFIERLFFPYEVRDGNYILIKPNGKYYYYLGEHSKDGIWENAEKYFTPR